MLPTLLIRPGGIGDCILSFPAMEKLAGEDTEIWVTDVGVPLVRFASGVRGLSSTGLDLVGLPGIETPPATLTALRRFDSIVSWYGANRPEFREAVERLGLPFRFLDALPSNERGMHAADFFLRQVGGQGVATPRIHCPRSDGGFAAIHPFSGSSKKNWPLEHFETTAERLGLPVRWCAGPEETLPDATRFEDLYQLALWLASARLYIGNDSGITHLAAAVGAPVVAVFGSTDPAVWGPRGERVRIVSSSDAWPDVDDVCKTAFDLLHTTPGVV